MPFDFVRKRVSVVVQTGESIQLITKGAFLQTLEICTHTLDGRPLEATTDSAIATRVTTNGAADGIRVLAVAVTEPGARGRPRSRDGERTCVFAGFLTFLDRPKESAAAAIRDLAALGVTVKLITGDARLVAAARRRAGRHATRRTCSPARQLDSCTTMRCGTRPSARTSSSRSIPIRRSASSGRSTQTGHVVGFLGDGVNDAPAMHAADTSLSVDEAVDVAREAADFVLLERDLDVIRRGIDEGRKTFANTLKYVLTTTSANLGNMVSMAAASLFLPFLPLTAGQILLNNFLSDIPAVGIADDSVDPELVDHAAALEHAVHRPLHDRVRRAELACSTA